MNVGDYTLEDTVTIPFTTRAFATGIPTALAGTPVVEIYEDDSVTQITAAETLTVSIDGVVGFNMLSVAATAANGFENGKSYTAIISTGTVGGVSVVGEVVGHFTIGRSAAAVDLANGTDGLGAIKAETALIVADTNELQSDDVPGLIAALNDLSAAAVNAEVVDALATDTYAEPTGVPAATTALATKIGFLYMALRNQLDVDTGTGFKEFYDDGGAIEWKKAISDDGTTYSEGEATTP